MDQNFVCTSASVITVATTSSKGYGDIISDNQTKLLFFVAVTMVTRQVLQVTIRRATIAIKPTPCVSAAWPSLQGPLQISQLARRWLRAVGLLQIRAWGSRGSIRFYGVRELRDLQGSAKHEMQFSASLHSWKHLLGITRYISNMLRPCTY